jgi:DNA-binding NtrC family response regulator
MDRLRVLLVDDDVALLESRVRVLKVLCPNWELFIADSGEAGLRFLERSGVDIVVTDIAMGGMAGTDLLRIVKSRHAHIVRMTLSGMLDHQALVEVAKWSEHNLCKPCSPEQMRDGVLAAMHKRFTPGAKAQA